MVVAFVLRQPRVKLSIKVPETNTCSTTKLLTWKPAIRYRPFPGNSTQNARIYARICQASEKKFTMLRKICRKECHQIYQCCHVRWHEPGAWIFNGFWHGDLPSSWIENVIKCVVAFAVFLKKLGLLFRLQYPGLFRMVCTPPGHNRFWLKRAGGEANWPVCTYIRVFFWRFRRAFVRAFATVHKVPASRSLSPTNGRRSQNVIRMTCWR